MIVTHRHRKYLDNYTCVETEIKTRVKCLAFQSGSVLYFKKDSFNYLVLSKDEVIKIEK